MQVKENFQHQQSAHCESGVMSALLKYKGLELSEPMVFGISGALSFAYLPFLKFGNMPLISYRMFPGHIIKRLPKILGVKYHRKRYRNPDRAMEDLAEFVETGQIVGIQTSAYFTPYFPPDMRFQFNAHNSIVIGKEDDEFIVSDPVFDQIKRIHWEDLQKARFARGLSAPKGLLHYPVHVPESIDLKKILKKAIKRTVNMMLHAPPPYIGVKGIRHLAKHIEKLPQKRDQKYIRLFLGNIVRMQEEIGTGGGGFRFLYAAFLQEAFQVLNMPILQEASFKMTETGDQWRLFAVNCAKLVKWKKPDVNIYELADLLRKCADSEKEIYIMLKNVKREK